MLSASTLADSIDDVVQAEMKRSKTPGVAVLLVRHGKPVMLKGYGVSNIENHVPVTPGTVFQSGSLGKQFTAALVMILVQEHKLRLDDYIVKYFPEGVGKWEGVTVRHLLNHTSGIGDMPYDSMDMHKEYSEDDMVNLMAKQKVRGIPGQNWSYCNGGYVLLGVMIHRVTGKFYGDLLHEKIFGPLGMKTAQIISEKNLVPNRAAGYEMVKNQITNQDWVSPSLNRTADGSLYLSILDLQKWDAALNKHKILTKSSLAEMWAPTVLNDGDFAIVNPGDKVPVCYGFGFTVCRRDGCTCIAHSGGWQGFRTHYTRVPELGLSVVVLANLDVADPATIGKSILEICEPRLKDGRKRADSRIP
jgi:CubicO group peptidase (beta-lactamase class C family)